MVQIKNYFRLVMKFLFKIFPVLLLICFSNIVLGQIDLQKSAERVLQRAENNTQRKLAKTVYERAREPQPPKRSNSESYSSSDRYDNNYDNYDPNNPSNSHSNPMLSNQQQGGGGFPLGFNNNLLNTMNPMNALNNMNNLNSMNNLNPMNPLNNMNPLNMQSLLMANLMGMNNPQQQQTQQDPNALNMALTQLLMQQQNTQQHQFQNLMNPNMNPNPNPSNNNQQINQLLTLLQGGGGGMGVGNVQSSNSPQNPSIPLTSTQIQSSIPLIENETLPEITDPRKSSSSNTNTNTTTTTTANLPQLQQLANLLRSQTNK